MTVRVVLSLALALLAAAAPPALAGDPRPAPRGVLIGMLLPFSEQQPVHGSIQIAVGPGGVRAAGVFANIETGYRVGLSQRPCAQLRRAKDPASLLATTYGRGTLRAGGRVKWTGPDLDANANELGRVRSIVILDNDGETEVARALACARPTATPIRGAAGPFGSLARLEAVGGSGVRAYLSAQETRGRMRVTGTIACDDPAQCARLMEEEGIFYYFDRAPCGQPPKSLGDRELGPALLARGASAFTLTDVLVSSVRQPANGISQRARSVRIRAGDELLACGANAPSRWAAP